MAKEVLLTASPETIYERVKDNNDRPVLQGRKNVAGISELMEQRREKYEAAADIVVNTDDKDVLTIGRRTGSEADKSGDISMFRILSRSIYGFCICNRF